MKIIELKKILLYVMYNTIMYIKCILKQPLL